MKTMLSPLEMCTNSSITAYVLKKNLAGKSPYGNHCNYYGTEKMGVSLGSGLLWFVLNFHFTFSSKYNGIIIISLIKWNTITEPRKTKCMKERVEHTYLNLMHLQWLMWIDVCEVKLTVQRYHNFIFQYLYLFFFW